MNLRDYFVGSRGFVIRGEPVVHRDLFLYHTCLSLDAGGRISCWHRGRGGLLLASLASQKVANGWGSIVVDLQQCARCGVSLVGVLVSSR